ncbi:MAG: type II toxin-antitoxin system VapC family toxin [Thermoleophilaceae bacterium]|nr:type II toxin-antitoxin system VapC family toxin [Thermoleophilaceae bacterium]
MRRFFYDTAVFLYALGGDHRYRASCREIVARAGRRELRGEASVDLLQELAHHRLRRTGDRARAAAEARDVASLCRLHDVQRQDVVRGLEVLTAGRRVGARDAVFAALALNRGVDAMLSPDRAFDEVAGLARIDPLDSQAVQALAVTRKP